MVSQVDIIICSITVLDFFLFSLFLLFAGEKRHISSRVFALFLLSEAITIGSFLLLRRVAYSGLSVPLLLYLATSFEFLKGPLLYFYTKSLTSRQFRLYRRDILHLAPFAAHAIYVAGLFLMYFTGSPNEELTRRIFTLSPDWVLINGILYAQILCYITASLAMVKKYVAALKDTVSYLERISLPWLKFILYGFAGMWAMWTSSYLGIVIAGKYFFWLDMIAMTLLFVTANAIIYNGLRLPELFVGIEEKPKYKDSPLTAEEKRRYIEKLMAYMTREKPYLNPSLSLNDLAGALAIAPRYLSQVINEHYRQNFYDFVNSYRIEAAKQQLLDQTRNRNVLEILYEVGFNSKSAFNLAFKNHTGLTPTEYRKKTFTAIPA